MPSYSLCQQLHSGAYTTAIHVHMTFFKKNIQEIIYVSLIFALSYHISFSHVVYLLEACSFLMLDRKGVDVEGREVGRNLAK